MTVTTLAQANWDRLGPSLADAIVDTLIMVSTTLIVSGILGLGLGMLLYTPRTGGILQNRFVYFIVNLLVNFVRPIPFIILLAFAQPLTVIVMGGSIGRGPATFVMVIAATFSVARVVEQNLVSIDPGVIEAARSMGASPWKIITSVIVPEALGPLILGYTFLFIAIVDMSAMAGYVGGGGLGDFAIVYGYRAFEWEVTVVATLIIIVLVQAVQGSDPAAIVADLADMEQRLAPRVKDIDYGVPGQGETTELDEAFYEYPLESVGRFMRSPDLARAEDTPLSESEADVEKPKRHARNIKRRKETER